MQLIYSTSKALDKWLKSELPILEGTQKGRNTIVTDENRLSWQLHIIDNSYKSSHKTIIATEANSRFTCFIPVEVPMSLADLHLQLSMQWQQLLIEMVIDNHLLPNSDAVFLLSKLDEVQFDINWTRNTDLSINGHITDAALWLTQTLADRGLGALPHTLAAGLASYLNVKIKRVKERKQKSTPFEKLFEYCLLMTESVGNKSPELETKQSIPNNVVQFSDYFK